MRGGFGRGLHQCRDYEDSPWREFGSRVKMEIPATNVMTGRREGRARVMDEACPRAIPGGGIALAFLHELTSLDAACNPATPFSRGPPHPFVTQVSVRVIPLGEGTHLESHHGRSRHVHGR